MSIELQAASSAEITQFKTAAAARYAARKVPPKIAELAFNRYMGKVATQLGVRQPPTERIHKLAAQLMKVIPTK